MADTVCVMFCATAFVTVTLGLAATVANAEVVLDTACVTQFVALAVRLWTFVAVSCAPVANPIGIVNLAVWVSPLLKAVFSVFVTWAKFCVMTWLSVTPTLLAVSARTPCVAVIPDATDNALVRLPVAAIPAVMEATRPEEMGIDATTVDTGVES